METKQSLRFIMKEKRSTLDIKALSDLIIKNLVKTEQFKNSKSILIYYPLKDEVNLLNLLEYKDKTYYLPKIINQDLVCCPYELGDSTCISCFKTCEPLTEPCEKNIIDLVIVPALACNKFGYRLGYGGGFYDRFLKDYNGIKITCIPQELLTESMFQEEHDVKIDYIVTEHSVIKTI